MLHIGNRIKEVFDQQPKNHTIDWLADKLNCQRANVYKIFNRQDIDMQLLSRLSYILGHDFFADLSRDYRKHIRDARSGNDVALREFHDEMMLSISRLLSRHLNRLPSELARPEEGRVLNALEGSNSTMPHTAYEIKIFAHEMPDIIPHVHVRSIAEKYDLRINIENGRVLSVKNYGIYDFGHSFDAVGFASYCWLVKDSVDYPGMSNQELARLYYRCLNP